MFDQRAAELDAKRRASGWVPEIERINNLPRASNSEAAGVALIRPWTDAWRAFGGVLDLRAIQAIALATLSTQPAPRGLFCSIGVGHGKTLISLLAARAVQAKRPLLLMGSDMDPQFRRDCVFWAKHFDIQVPHVVHYSRLSQADATDLLTELDPDLVIVDECQNLRNATAARTKRVLRFARANPHVRWVMMSGTTASKSLADYSHLMELALRSGSPLPIVHHDLDLWRSVVDVGGEPDRHAIRAMIPLLKAEGITPTPFQLADTLTMQGLCRRAIHSRQSTTPGVISTETMSLNADLELVQYRVPPVKEIVEALHTLEHDWTRPDGEEIASASQKASIARQLSMGFYYVWDWPDGVVDQDWLDKRLTWQRAVRRALGFASGVGHDSPLLVSRRCARANKKERARADWHKVKGCEDWPHWAAIRERWYKAQRAKNVPPDRLSAWQDWQDVKARKPPPRLAVWLTSVILDDIEDWSRAHPRGIIWYHHEAVGEALAARGFQVFGSGSDVPDNTVDHPVCSISVHGTGKNLQAWSEQLIAQSPSGGQIMEQLLGRTHRLGQLATVIRAYYLAHTTAARAAMESAIVDATFIETTQGSPQRLLQCTSARDIPNWLKKPLTHT